MDKSDIGVSQQRDGAQAFRRAARHSRRVRVLRRAIPVIVILILGATVLVRWLDPLRVLARLPGSVEGLVISGTKITMEAPKLSGYTSDSRWYELTARSAAQDITKPNLIELNSVSAKIQAEDKSTVHVSATDGVYDRSSGMLKLERDIKLTSTTGYEVHLQEALINTGTSEIISEKPVEVLTQQGTIKANRLEVLDGGEVLRFIGAVVVNLPSSGPDAAQPPAQKP